MAKPLFETLLDEIFDTIFNHGDENQRLGSYGEKLTARKLKMMRFFGYEGRILMNAYIPKADGTTSEIDVLFVTEKGIFVIESKNYSGWIFGSEGQFKWTASLPNGQKNRFYNPISQNKNHIKWLSGYLSEDIPLFSIIVFSERCELKKLTITSPEVKVVKRDSLTAAVRRIWKDSPSVLDENKVERIYQRLLPLTNKTEAEKNAHVENIKSRIDKQTPRKPVPQPAHRPAPTKADGPSYSAKTDEQANNKKTPPEKMSTAPACPICASPMVLRYARRGERAGKQFWGCSAYPKCHGIVNID